MCGELYFFTPSSDKLNLSCITGIIYRYQIEFAVDDEESMQLENLIAVLDKLFGRINTMATIMETQSWLRNNIVNVVSVIPAFIILLLIRFFKLMIESIKNIVFKNNLESHDY